MFDNIDNLAKEMVSAHVQKRAPSGPKSIRFKECEGTAILTGFQEGEDDDWGNNIILLRAIVVRAGQTNDEVDDINKPGERVYYRYRLYKDPSKRENSLKTLKRDLCEFFNESPEDMTEESFKNMFSAIEAGKLNGLLVDFYPRVFEAGKTKILYTNFRRHPRLNSASEVVSRGEQLKRGEVPTVDLND